MRPGDLIARYPELTFYPDDYLLARHAAGALQTRLEEFEACLDDPTAAERLIAAALANGSLHHIPAYAPFRGAALRDLPLIDKSALRERATQFQRPASGEPRWVKMTTGTSGPPAPVLYDAAFYFEALLLSHVKIAMRAGIGVRDAPVFCIGINDKKAADEMVAADPAARTGLSVQLHVDERRAGTFERAVAMLLDLHPPCVTSKPSLFDQFCAIAGERGRTIGRQLDFVTLSGMTLLPETRARIEDCLHAPVIDAYTMTEFGLIASQCRAGGMHVDSSAVVVEAIDDSGNALGPGRPGDLVISGIRNAAMPLLRYKTGDYGALLASRCDCGSRAPRLTNLLGKKIACFRLADGKLFSPTFFNDLLSRFPAISEFQIAQYSPSRYRVVVEPLSLGAAEMEPVRTYIAEALPGSPLVTIETGMLAKGIGFQRYRTEA